MAWAASSNKKETASFAAKAEGQWASGNAYHFTILLDGEAIGGVGIEVRGPIERIGELGYWVRTDLCGQGFATEAGIATVDFGFEELGLDRLELRAGPAIEPVRGWRRSWGFNVKERSGRPLAERSPPTTAISTDSSLRILAPPAWGRR